MMTATENILEQAEQWLAADQSQDNISFAKAAIAAGMPCSFPEAQAHVNAILQKLAAVETEAVTALAPSEPVVEIVPDVVSETTPEDAGTTDDDIKTFARNLFKQNHSYAKTVEGLLAEFDGITPEEARDFTGQALED